MVDLSPVGHSESGSVEASAKGSRLIRHCLLVISARIFRHLRKGEISSLVFAGYHCSSLQKQSHHLASFGIICIIWHIYMSLHLLAIIVIITMGIILIAIFLTIIIIIV